MQPTLSLLSLIPALHLLAAHPRTLTSWAAGWVRYQAASAVRVATREAEEAKQSGLPSPPPGHRWAPFLPLPDTPSARTADAGAKAVVAQRLASGAPRALVGVDGVALNATEKSRALSAVSWRPHWPWPWPWPPHPPAPPPPPAPPAPRPWTPHSSAGLTPFLPPDIMWLLAEAEAAASNATRARARLAEAAALAALNSVAYCPHVSVAAWSCRRCAPRAGPFDVHSTVYDAGWDLFAYAGYSHVLAAPVIAFRGTDSRSIYNWAENMRYWRSDLPLPIPGGAASGAAVHTGFFMSWNDSALAPNLTAAARALAAAHPGAPLYIAGHSLGAALATVAAVDIKFRLEAAWAEETAAWEKVEAAKRRRRRRRRLATSDAPDPPPPPPPPIRLFTFGSPRVGNAAFASFVDRATATSVRVTHNRDIVPSVPPTWVGFHHLATEAWQVDMGGTGVGVVGLCDASGEDPRCHDSVCILGLCTSVSDHLEYLGSPMLHTVAPGSPDAC